MQTRRALAADWPAVRDLLSAAGLPLDGAVRAFASGLVVTEGDRIVGCAAVEPYDRAALLRSVAVAQDRRGAGIGTHLIEASEDLARDNGATALILLTETAAPWFSRRGYETVERTSVPADVARSIEFETACSTAAVAMRRHLVEAQER